MTVKLEVTETGNVTVSQLIARMEHAAKRLMPEVRQAIGAEALRQIDRGFSENRDPYGRSWAPLKSGKGAPLQGLRGTFGVRPATLTIYGATPKVKPFVFGFLNYGTRNVTGANKGKSKRYGAFRIEVVGGKKRRVYDAKKRTLRVPERLMIPRRMLGLPEIWERSFDPEVKRLLEHFLRERGER